MVTLCRVYGWDGKQQYWRHVFGDLQRYAIIAHICRGASNAAY
jgi:hypothetical protein